MSAIFIQPYFGTLPSWYEQYAGHVKHLEQYGYFRFVDTDLDGFKRRVKKTLGVKCSIVPGTGKVWDYRPALGALYPDIIDGFDFWGHTDMDCVYGRVDKWVTQEFLDELDVHSNHHSYVCGPWTLYRNKCAVNELFRQHPGWVDILENPIITAWAETDFSRLLERSSLRYKYTYWQNLDPSDDSQIAFRSGALYDHNQEIMMHHFRRTKRWPLP